MRTKSPTVAGIQVFAVAGTNTVSFGIRATKTARRRLLGFAVKRTDTATGRSFWMDGYKVFRSLVPMPTADTVVSTYDHPVQSLVWDDFTAAPGHTYEYLFQPLRGTPAHLDRSAPPVTISVTTEPLKGQRHDVFFNRGVTASQSYAKTFHNLGPEKQPTAAKRAKAYKWLARDLQSAMLGFIRSARRGDALRGCFYEFQNAAVLAELRTAIDRGVDVELIIDEKVNEHTINPTAKNKLTAPLFVPSDPRTANLKAITDADLPPTSIVPRVARRDDIQHNKFMVLLRGAARTPTEVWTGSTNLTDSGIFGQANVGHHVRDEATASTFLEYWTVLAADPGAPTNATKDPLNVAYLQAVDTLTPTPAHIDAIPAGITPLFSPRGNLAPLTLYVDLVAQATSLSCITFAFGIPQPFRDALAASGPDGPLHFLLLEDRDNPQPTKARPTVVRLNAQDNTYEAFGSELHTALGRWVVETDNTKIGLTKWVTFIHLKFLLHDPLGADPIVVTGSANFSEASTEENDENMLVIRGDRRVADIYFTEFNRLWAHYQFRSVVENTARRRGDGDTTPAHDVQFLYEDTGWLADYEPGRLRAKRVQLYVGMVL